MALPVTIIWGEIIPDSLPFVTSLYVAMLVRGAGEFFHLHKKWKKKMSAMLRQTFVYDVHENYMEIRIYEAERLLHLHWVPYSELKKIREKKGCMFFSFEDTWFMVRKADLQEGSLLYKALITYWTSSHSE